MHFMKGDNDEILCWPWEGNIRIILINQQQTGYERSVSIICKLLRNKDMFISFQESYY